jgi:ABC-type Fe3+/spermidine/putrescine transport system ATPase subunit
MREGRIEQLGSPEQIYRRPASLFVAGFIGQANLVPGTVAAVRAGRVTLDTPLGRLAAPAGDAPPARGEHRVLFFRPEAARLGAAGGTDANRFRGRLVSREYLGAQVQAAVDCGAHRLILSLPPGYRAAGEAVRFSVDPADCWLLPADGAAQLSSPGS